MHYQAYKLKIPRRGARKGRKLGSKSNKTSALTSMYLINNIPDIF